ncbi:hypothetical protein [Flavobacterium sp. 83]|uniref:hypothetical protein n=1 Tax=Flavobacterium sp. 83 TaxID=1131812 RepID=UPI0005535A6E|nr:hypothetical protein [Flavobacterium sp. 83]
MKKFLIFLVLIGLNKSYSQNDYATINIYRPKMMLGSAITHTINLNGKKVCKMDNGGHLEYKMFTQANVYITIDGKEDIERKDGVKISVEKGKIYNIKIYPKFGKMGIEQIGNPIEKEDLKSKYYISLNDIGFDGNATNNEMPKTEWTKENLIKHWNENGISEIEGIYEVVGGKIKYELAVIKNNGTYSLIYLSGANGSSWNTGDIKATLKKTASFGMFMSNWYLLNKLQSKDVLITFKDSTFSVVSGESNDNDTYVKTYPTYESKVKKKE